MSTRIIRAVTVYCGSGPGNDPAFVQAGHDIGEIFAAQDVEGVYGGGFVGVMGSFGSSIISHGGRVTGVIPEFLIAKEQPIVEQGHHGFAKHDRYHLIRTPDMYQRKKKFRELADGFVCLPGGVGTRDELYEEATGIQIGEHKKPIVVANINDAFKYVLLDIELMRHQMFIRENLEFSSLFRVVERVDQVLPALREMVGETNVVPIDAALKAAG